MGLADTRVQISKYVEEKSHRVWGEPRADSWELAATYGKKSRNFTIITFGFQNSTYRSLAHSFGYNVGTANIKEKVDKSRSHMAREKQESELP